MTKLKLKSCSHVKSPVKKTSNYKIRDTLVLILVLHILYLFLNLDFNPDQQEQEIKFMKCLSVFFPLGYIDLSQPRC